MAERGGAGQGGRGGTDPLRAALTLNSDQQRDRRAETEDIFAGDEGVTDELKPSVLDAGAPTRSYTEEQLPDAGSPIAGGGILESPALELDRQRAREEHMRRTQEQFVGQPSERAERTPGEETRAEPEREQETPPEPEPDLAEEEDEQARARKLEAQQEAERERSERQNALVEANQNLTQAHSNAERQLWDYWKAGNAGLAVLSLGATLVINNLILAVQVINKYTFKHPKIPPPRFEEELCCIGGNLTCVACSPFAPPCYWGCILVLVAATMLLLLPAVHIIRHVL